ncbi:hypothetical protein ACGFT2_24595 [Streptomyces sp. NPDC048514]|uniref:hypothetical protein n=1 Tax=Streptomyces sp. NPDC048514 TaxID=3365564 RepID=UPI00371050F2
MLKHKNSLRTGLIAAVAAAALAGGITTASADDVEVPNVDDSYAAVQDEAGLVDLFNPADNAVANFSSHLSGWAPGSKESRHWDDNDYTEIMFTGCTLVSSRGSSVDVKLWQDIPMSLDKSLGTKRFTNCFKGATKTSRGEWDGHYEGSKRYFTIPALNGDTQAHDQVNVDRVRVDTTKAD